MTKLPQRKPIVMTGEGIVIWRARMRFTKLRASAALGYKHQHQVALLESGHQRITPVVANLCTAYERLSELGAYEPITLTEMTAQDFKKWRARMEMTQKQAAKAIGYRADTIKKLEGGKSRVTNRVAMLCAALEKVRLAEYETDDEIPLVEAEKPMIQKHPATPLIWKNE